jgi:hypothetical protein
MFMAVRRESHDGFYQREQRRTTAPVTVDVPSAQVVPRFAKSVGDCEIDIETHVVECHAEHLGDCQRKPNIVSCRQSKIDQLGFH